MGNLLTCIHVYHNEPSNFELYIPEQHFINHNGKYMFTANSIVYHNGTASLYYKFYRTGPISQVGLNPGLDRA